MNPELKHTRWGDYGKGVEQLVGKTLAEVTQGEYYGGDGIFFVVDDNEAYVMYYEPDCCASCNIEDIVGDLQDLVHDPILTAMEDSNSDNPKKHKSYDESYEYEDESSTWTFYNIATRRGHVTIRWYGSSNGYYSEKASFRRLYTSDKE